MTRILIGLALAASVAIAALATARAQVTPQQYLLLFGSNSSTSGSNPGSGCANQLVLDYSNSCALIAQAWGQ